MKYPVIVLPFLKVNGMAIFPFIFIRDAAGKHDQCLIWHETIHLKQQLELLILPFYVLYFANYVCNRFKYANHHDAYLNIIFERECYTEELNAAYLSQRKLWAWRRY